METEHTEIIDGHQQEKRQSFRVSFTHPLTAEMTILEINHMKVNIGTTAVLIDNMGPGCLRFQSAVKLPPIKGMILGLNTTLLGYPLHISGKVIWTKTIGSEQYNYGLEYILDRVMLI